MAMASGSANGSAAAATVTPESSASQPSTATTHNAAIVACSRPSVRRGFQIVQSLMAFGAGGIFGQGIGQGSPNYIPVVHSDFAFAAVAERLGDISFRRYSSGPWCLTSGLSMRDLLNAPVTQQVRRASH